ncbi:hypothetical protein V500_08085 [Pseudogymnoascus sp. VKM F-4518 (FW-2643)]|nr:hypothetical protein V500_08085 [Pseudogymnoascus sp. VKM F-4518 (FW-2643)]
MWPNCGVLGGYLTAKNKEAQGANQNTIPRDIKAPDIRTLVMVSLALFLALPANNGPHGTAPAGWDSATNGACTGPN